MENEEKSEKLNSEHKINEACVRTGDVPQGLSLIEHLFFIRQAILDPCESHWILMGIISSCIMWPGGNRTAPRFLFFKLKDIKGKENFCTKRKSSSQPERPTSSKVETGRRRQRPERFKFSAKGCGPSPQIQEGQR